MQFFTRRPSGAATVAASAVPLLCPFGSRDIIFSGQLLENNRRDGFGDMRQQLPTLME